jgi:serpin B
MWRGLLLSALMATALPAGLLAGCSSSGPPGEPTTYVTAQSAADITVSDAAYQQAETGSEAFGVALLRSLGDAAGDANLVFSPQTLVNLLAMILPGAQGQTATQLSDALGDAGLSASASAGALGRMDATDRADANQGSNTLDVSSDVWTTTGLKLAQSYLATLDGAFGIGVHQTGFAADPSGAAQAIDSLVSQETHGYIPRLFEPDTLDASTRLVLTDAVYLNATWATPFDPNLTAPSSFHLADGSTTQISTMNRTGEYDYASGNGWQLVELPYSGGKTAMDILLPGSGSNALPVLRDGLSAPSLNAMLGSMREQNVALSIPKFTTESSEDNLAGTLAMLGLAGLFSDADLAGMTADHEPLWVSQIVEKAYVAVGEKGTVAAAAAGGAIATSARSAQGLAFVADHPFLYLVRDLSTGQILFAGQFTGH